MFQSEFIEYCRNACPLASSCRGRKKSFSARPHYFGNTWTTSAPPNAWPLVLLLRSRAVQMKSETTPLTAGPTGDTWRANIREEHTVAVMQERDTITNAV